MFSRFGNNLFRLRYKKDDVVREIDINSLSYLSSFLYSLSIDPSGSDFIDYSTDGTYHSTAYGININDTVDTLLQIKQGNSNFNFNSEELTIILKYVVHNEIDNDNVVDFVINNPLYDISSNGDTFDIGNNVNFFITKASNSNITYTISGNNLFTIDIPATGTIQDIETEISFNIMTGFGNLKILLDNVDISKSIVVNNAGSEIVTSTILPSESYIGATDLNWNNGISASDMTIATIKDTISDSYKAKMYFRDNGDGTQFNNNVSGLIGNNQRLSLGPSLQTHRYYMGSTSSSSTLESNYRSYLLIPNIQTGSQGFSFSFWVRADDNDIPHNDTYTSSNHVIGNANGGIWFDISGSDANGNTKRVYQDYFFSGEWITGYHTGRIYTHGSSGNPTHNNNGWYSNADEYWKTTGRSSGYASWLTWPWQEGGVIYKTNDTWMLHTYSFNYDGTYMKIDKFLNNILTARMWYSNYYLGKDDNTEINVSSYTEAQLKEAYEVHGYHTYSYAFDQTNELNIVNTTIDLKLLVNLQMEIAEVNIFDRPVTWTEVEEMYNASDYIKNLYTPGFTV